MQNIHMKKIIFPLLLIALGLVFSSVSASNDEYLTRAEAVKMIMDDMEIDVESYTRPSGISHKYKSELVSAYHLYILDGAFRDFRADEMLNYAELSAMIARAYFFDNELNKKGDPWYENYILLMEENGLVPILGLEPYQGVTQSEFINLLNKLTPKKRPKLDITQVKKGDVFGNFKVSSVEYEEELFENTEARILHDKVIFEAITPQKIKGEYVNYGAVLSPEGKLISGVREGLFMNASKSWFPYSINLRDKETVISDRILSIEKFFDKPDLSMYSTGNAEIIVSKFMIYNDKAKRDQDFGIVILEGVEPKLKKTAN